MASIPGRPHNPGDLHDPGDEHGPDRPPGRATCRGRVGGKVADTVGEKVEDLGAYLREQRQHARLSVRQLAARTGISNPYLSQIERGLRRPSAEVLQQIARGLRISAEALYVRAGILDMHHRPQIEVAIQTDPHLTARQKAVLLDIYASFLAGHHGREPGTDGADGSRAEQEPDAGGPRDVDRPRPHRARAVRRTAIDGGDQGGSP